MRILFFHGFESKLPSGKANWLEGEGYTVYARPMEYDRPDAFLGALACAQEFKPDVIIGSSMGGYFASLVGTHLNTKLVLLNPALHSRTREYDHAPNGGYQPKVWALLGENDTIIEPKKSLEPLRAMKARITVGPHAHRTPLDVFSGYMREIVDELMS